MGWWHDTWTTESRQWTHHWLTDEQDPGAPAIGEVAPDTAYLSVILRNLYVPYVRKGLSRFYGIVDAYSRLPSRDGSTAEFHVATTPTQLRNADSKALHNVIALSSRVLGPVPYRGGDLSVEIGLFSIKTQDLLAPYISLLEGLGDAAGVSFVATAKPFVSLVTSGLEQLTGAADAGLEVGIAGQFIPVRSGRLAVIRLERKDLDPSSLRVVDSRLLTVDSREVTAPYMLLDFEASTRRSDWFQIPDVAASYGLLRASVRDGDYEAAKVRLVEFRRTVMTSPDLLVTDARRVNQLVSDEIDAIMGDTVKTGATAVDLPELSELLLY